MVNILTEEEIAKVFAMYLMQTVIVEETHECQLLGFEYYGYPRPVVINWKEWPKSVVVNDWGLIKLQLTPLSKISDEHAVIIRDNFLKLYSIDTKDVFPIVVMVLNIEVQIGNDTLLRQFTVRELIDLEKQLQLWGYATKLYFGINHPANNKTAIELGIAIEKQ